MRNRTTKTPRLTVRPEWKALQRHAAPLRRRHLRELFEADAERGERFALDAAGLYLDYAKQRVDATTMKLLVRLADACGVRERAEAMFRGERINTTEDRAVLHVAEHRFGALAHAGGVGEAQQQLHRLRIDALLGVIEVKARRLERETFAAIGVGREQFAQMAPAHGRHMALQRFPFGARRQLHTRLVAGSGCHRLNARRRLRPP